MNMNASSNAGESLSLFKRYLVCREGISAKWGTGKICNTAGCLARVSLVKIPWYLIIEEVFDNRYSVQFCNRFFLG